MELVFLPLPIALLPIVISLKFNAGTEPALPPERTVPSSVLALVTPPRDAKMEAVLESLTLAPQTTAVL
jgi:hypothetical protein